MAKNVEFDNGYVLQPQNGMDKITTYTYTTLLSSIPLRPQSLPVNTVVRLRGGGRRLFKVMENVGSGEYLVSEMTDRFAVSTSPFYIRSEHIEGVVNTVETAPTETESTTTQTQDIPPRPIKKMVKINFNSVVISDDKRQQIVEALEQVNKSELIFEKWDFQSIFEKGKGIALLFYGPPGTGKTLMGQAIAQRQKKKLKVIGTADIESSSPGESERNIRKYFQEAAKSGDILLFDECDSLIFTRKNVGPILGAQINELLSQVERHEGITIFTTNRLGTLDEAVNRRLALKLEFAMPTYEERVKIWRRMFPKKAPLADNVDFNKLASIDIAGGYIKNTVLRAARMAAAEPIDDDFKQITMNHLVRALRLEVESMLEFEAARNVFEKGYVDVGTATTETDKEGRDKSGKKVVKRIRRPKSEPLGQ